VMIALLLGMAFASPAQAGPVVLELFTSQGCSSCPPADALLTMLSADKDVLPLSFHIDYWDSPAWTDPFALPASSGRQRAYAHALGLDNVFTPQLIVGSWPRPHPALNGSRRNRSMGGSVQGAGKHKHPGRRKRRPDFAKRQQRDVD
jgi:hypothetical protein